MAMLRTRQITAILDFAAKCRDLTAFAIIVAAVLGVVYLAPAEETPRTVACVAALGVLAILGRQIRNLKSPDEK